MADTKWSVITESGELISESTSAFPRFVLLEGTYTAIARNNDKIYSQDFTVQAGVNRDVEVLVEGYIRRYDGACACVLPVQDRTLPGTESPSGPCGP